MNMMAGWALRMLKQYEELICLVHIIIFLQETSSIIKLYITIGE